jgi:hypothetical protein
MRRRFRPLTLEHPNGRLALALEGDKAGAWIMSKEDFVLIKWQF